MDKPSPVVISTRERPRNAVYDRIWKLVSEEIVLHVDISIDKEEIEDLIMLGLREQVQHSLRQISFSND